ncbi:Putative flippase GtrA (transmembrane translocase of bactoprenol-linked glucose) [Agromyces sp. CF514]|uniref:GtrA family protein n=1 Tax=Agromyces sp. CF514 TaxID=1881031 RepID=UPI0008EDD233|nr:GtrA family protein [Agromyces sp. CF514]SFR86255.1 Putative flippase GtrA (transmembrane translocase of bactoprenol-linked glucose) [Agromyces sp. CF514]
MSSTARSALSRAWEGLLAYLVKFGVVGLIGLVIDVALFNLLRIGVFGEDHWAQSAIGAKTISTSVAIIFNWLGNRYWTFRSHRRKNYLREFVEYVVVSLGGMAIALGCLWVSHHWLGYTSLVADNIATNVVGLGLGTAFRFVLYRYWVYGHHRSDGLSNLDRVEEAQRTIFEEPEHEHADAAGGPSTPAGPDAADGQGPAALSSR